MIIFEIIAAGFIVALGLILLFWRCNWSKRFWMLSHPVTMDVAIFVFLNVIHWGSFTGPMVAAAGAAMCSMLLIAGRALFGHVTKNNGSRFYHRGLFDKGNVLGIQ